MLGNCKKQDRCLFAHGEEERRPRQALDIDDITPFMRVYGALKMPKDVNGALRGPRLEFVIHNCCELDAINDTRTIARLGEAMLPGLLYFTFGCHPHNYRDYSDEFEKKMLAEKDALGERAVAWGECGLDYYKNA